MLLDRPEEKYYWLLSVLHSEVTYWPHKRQGYLFLYPGFTKIQDQDFYFKIKAMFQVGVKGERQ